jgi:homogentisate 1,2-dioxygenase
VFVLSKTVDIHPKSIPAPYNHSNIDSDEVLYYVDGDFISQQYRARTHHQAFQNTAPGAMERSIGHGNRTSGVMMTFRLVTR